MSYKIILGLDKELDGISPKTKLALTFAEANFNSLVSKGGTLSNNFSLNKTANNKRQLGLLDEVNSLSEIPYNFYQCRLIDTDGICFFNGLASIEESQDTYNLRLFSGVANFFELVGNKLISDIDLSALDHEWTASNVNGARQNANTQGYVYPNINYGRWTEQTLGDRPHTDFYPAVYFKRILEQAAIGEGYTLLNYDTNKAIAFSQRVFENSTEYYVNLNSFGLVNVNNIVGTTRPLALNVFSDPGNFAKEVLTGDTVSILDGTIAAFEVSVAINNDSGFDIVIGFGKDASNFLSSATILNNSVGVFIYYGTITEAGDYGIYCNTGTVVKIAAGGVSTFIRATIEKFAINDGNPIKISDTLPKVKIKDLFLYEAVRTNSLVIIDPIEKTIEFKRFSEIAANKSALDWTKKLDTLTKIKYSYRLNEYGQNNFLRYKEGVEEDPSYAVNNDIGLGNFEVADKALQLDREWYTAPFAASGKSFAFGSEPPLILVPRYSDTSLGFAEADIDPKPRVLDVSINDSMLITITGEAAPTTQANVTFEGFSDSIEIYYEGLLGAFTAMKLAELYVRLDSSDISKLDITTPIFINGAYWFIREVVQYQPANAASTKLKLIRL